MALSPVCIHCVYTYKRQTKVCSLVLEVLNREAEGQLEAAEHLSSLDSKFSSVGRNSLDMFSPARDGLCDLISESIPVLHC